MIKKIITYSFLLLSLAARSQVTVTANGPRVVDIGEQFQVSYVISAEPSGFKAPDFSAFDFLSGPNRSSSSSISIINGSIKQSTTLSFTYILQPKKVGTFTLEPAKVTVGGKNYTSNSLSIEVVNSASNNGGQQQQTQSGAKQNQQQNTQEADIPDDQVFLKVLVDKTSLYQGEYLTATVKLYSLLNVNDVGNIQLPKFNGVYSQEIELPQIRLNRENINGRVYFTAVIKQYYLFPQQSGEIPIDACSIDAVVAQKAANRARTPFDDFWGFESDQYQWVKKNVKSKPFKLSVKPLPAGAPESFKGAVGNFTFKAAVNKNNVKTNDALSLKVTVNGNGNIKLIDPIAPKLPTDFEAYDPKTNIAIKGISGSKTFEYVMIPRHSGVFNIPGIEFCYFDPQQKQYKTLRSEDFKIDVSKGNENENDGNVVVAGNRDDVKFLGKDIRFIKEGRSSLVQQNQWFYGSWKFYFIYGIAILLFLLFVIAKRKQIIENANIAKVRNKRANKQAQKRLKEAYSCIKIDNKERFYEEVLKAMWGYLSDKFNISASELSREKVMEIISLKNVGEEQIQILNSLLDNCEMVRYAPSAVSSDLEDTYNKAVELISNFENVI